MQEPDPEIVNKLERILQNGKNSKTDPHTLALKVTLKAIELLSIPQCAGGNNNNNNNSLASLTKSCIEKAFDVALTESINLIHKGDFNPKLIATKIVLRITAVLLKATCSRLRKCRTRKNPSNNTSRNNNSRNNSEKEKAN
jgi:hypothetical protein